MGRFLFCLFLAAITADPPPAPVPASAPTPAPAPAFGTPASTPAPAATTDAAVIKDFSGGGTTTTGLFHVHNRWEVRWSARRAVSVAVMAANGTIVAGGSGVIRGSLFVPMGGDYYLRITDDSTSADSANGASVDSEEGSTSWHLQVVELPASVAADEALTVYKPYFSVPDSAVTPNTPVPPPAPPKLNEAQARAVVIVKGDNAQGAGFLVKLPQGTFVLTHLHLLIDNPNIQLTTATGTPLTVLSVKGALDRNLALFAVKGDQLSPLPMPADSATPVAIGEWVIIPDLGPAGELTDAKAAHVIGLSPQRIDFDQQVNPTSDGVPIIQASTGNVVAILTAEKRVNLTDTVAQAWALNPAPGSAKVIPNYGLPLASVNWENYDLARFQSESQFLKQFHEVTRSLDSYLNGRKRGKFSPPGDDGPPDNRYYQTNPQLRDAQTGFSQLAGGADEAQQLEAATELLNSLQTAADTDYSTLNDGASGFYVYDQRWAREELAYRREIKKQLDDMSDDPSRLNSIARSR